jgi:hypothetical protein
MIPFKINGQKIQIPTSWGDVTYSQYVTLLTTPNNLIYYVSLFTGISVDTLTKAQIKNIDKLAIALSFITIPPKIEAEPTKLVGPYFLPKDITTESLGQFEDLRNLIKQFPKEPDPEKLAELYLKACAIYCQKIKDGKYDPAKVPAMEEELKGYSCIEVTQTGGFFLFRQVNLLTGTKTRSQNIIQRLKKLIVGSPGYRKTLDLPQPSLGKVKE